MFISLSSSSAGNACAIRQSIINYTNDKSETQFFDWLVCSMKSINEVLEGKPILFENNFIHSKSNISIKFLNFNNLISHHDVKEININTINEITEKYKRRYDRLINTIKTQTNLSFIRYCKDLNNLEEDEIYNFFKIINYINPNLIFKFILISDCDNLVLPTNLLNKNNFIYINLNEYIDDDIINEPNGYFKNIKKNKCIFNIIQ